MSCPSSSGKQKNPGHRPGFLLFHCFFCCVDVAGHHHQNTLPPPVNVSVLQLRNLGGAVVRIFVNLVLDVVFQGVHRGLGLVAVSKNQHHRLLAGGPGGAASGAARQVLSLQAGLLQPIQHKGNIRVQSLQIIEVRVKGPRPINGGHVGGVVKGRVVLFPAAGGQAQRQSQGQGNSQQFFHPCTLPSSVDVSGPAGSMASPGSSAPGKPWGYSLSNSTVWVFR